MIGVEKIPTLYAKLPKTMEKNSNKSAKKFRSMGDNGPTTFDSNDFDVADCNISEVIFSCKSLLEVLMLVL
jgi:hypothetical protein